MAYKKEEIHVNQTQYDLGEVGPQKVFSTAKDFAYGIV